MEWIAGSRIRYGRLPPLAFRRKTSLPFGRRHVFTSFTPPPILVYPNYILQSVVEVINFITKPSYKILLHSCHFALPSFPLPLSSSFSQSRTRQGFAVCTAVLHRLRFPTPATPGRLPAFLPPLRDSLMLSRSVLGIALASAAGVFWGSMSIAAQYLMESVAFDAVDLTALRLTGAGVLLLALESFVLREDVFAPFRDGRDRRDLVFYALGMLGIQLAFFLSIREANAATAALTATTGPLFVTG